MSTDSEKWVEQIEGSELRDASHLRSVGRALDEVDRAERILRAAVASAREHGDSWAAIGAVLGTTRQAAQQRFGDVVVATSGDAEVRDETVLLLSIDSEVEMHAALELLYKVLDPRMSSNDEWSAADVMVVPRPHRWHQDDVV